MIVEPATLVLFALTSLALNLTPGPDMLYALGRSVTQGPRAGLAAASGHLAGTLVHTVALVLGLSAVLAASAEAMTAVRIAGAVVLAAIGLRMLLHPPGAGSKRYHRPAASPGRIMCESFVIHALNPKTAIFFLAFVPQFVRVDADAATAAAQSAFLGLWFAVQAAAVLGVLSVVGGCVAGRLRRHEALVTGLKRGVGAVLVLVGARLAFR